MYSTILRFMQCCETDNLLMLVLILLGAAMQ